MTLRFVFQSHKFDKSFKAKISSVFCETDTVSAASKHTRRRKNCGYEVDSDKEKKNKKYVSLKEKEPRFKKKKKEKEPDGTQLLKNNNNN